MAEPSPWCTWGNWIYVVFALAFLVFIVLVADKVISVIFFGIFVLITLILFLFCYGCCRPIKTEVISPRPTYPNYNTGSDEEQLLSSAQPSQYRTAL
jgi:hypothetical protein